MVIDHPVVRIEALIEEDALDQVHGRLDAEDRKFAGHGVDAGAVKSWLARTSGSVRVRVGTQIRSDPDT